MVDQASFSVSNPADYAPPNAMFFGAIGQHAVPVTPDTPLPVAFGGAIPSLSLLERLNREGDPTANFATLPVTSFAAPSGAGTPGPFGVALPAPGRAIYIQSVGFWATTPIRGRAQIGNGVSAWSGTGAAALMDIGFACGPALACAPIPVNAFVRSSDRINMGSFITGWLDPAVSGTHYVGASASAFTLADSINFEAKKTILMLGDSTWNGNGPSTVDTCIPYLINRHYRDGGIDCRYILKAYSGSTSTGHEAYRRNGKYDFPQVDAIFYNLGVNDAAQAVPTATSMANVQALIGWKQKRYPKAKLVIFGSIPLQTAAYEAALVALRAAQQACVAAMSDPNVLFCDLGASFDRAVGANYMSSDGADGTRVHPADAGLTQLWQGGYAGNAGLRAWLAANLPAI